MTELSKRRKGCFVKHMHPSPMFLSPTLRLPIFKGKTRSKFKDKWLPIVFLEIRKAFPIQLYTLMSTIFRVLSSHSTSIFQNLSKTLPRCQLFWRAVTLDYMKEFAFRILWQLLNYAASKLGKPGPSLWERRWVASQGSTPSDKPGLRTPQVSHFVDNSHIFEGKNIHRVQS